MMLAQKKLFSVDLPPPPPPLGPNLWTFSVIPALSVNYDILVKIWFGLVWFKLEYPDCFLEIWFCQSRKSVWYFPLPQVKTECSRIKEWAHISTFYLSKSTQNGPETFSAEAENGKLPVEDTSISWRVPVLLKDLGISGSSRKTWQIRCMKLKRVKTSLQSGRNSLPATHLAGKYLESIKNVKHPKSHAVNTWAKELGSFLKKHREPINMWKDGWHLAHCENSKLLWNS